MLSNLSMNYEYHYDDNENVEGFGCFDPKADTAECCSKVVLATAVTVAVALVFGFVQRAPTVVVAYS